MVMTCIEADVLAKLSTEATNQRLEHIDYDMVFYADDTIVFSKTLQGIEEILGLVQQISGDYGLKHNKGEFHIYIFIYIFLYIYYKSIIEYIILKY